MKLSIGGIKDLKLKQFVVTHGEKAVAVVVGLLGLLMLVITPWSVYQKSPEEMQSAADDARRKIDKRVWTDAESKQYRFAETIDLQVNKLLSPVNPAGYALTIPEIPPLWGVKQKISEPKWLAAEDAVATYGRASLAMPNPEARSATNPTEENSKTNGVGPLADGATEDDDTAEFKPPAGGAAPDDTRTPRGRVLGSGAGAKTKFGGFGKRKAERDEEDQQIKLRQQREQQEKEELERQQKKRGGRPVIDPTQPAYSAIVSRGERFVSVRAVLPIDEQYREIASAFHEPYVPDRFANSVWVVDYELERQQVLPDGSWSEWQRVDKSIPMDILREFNGEADYDIVDPAITSNAITMPLLPRACGRWTKRYASHPRIEKYELTEEQMNLYYEMIDQMLTSEEDALRKKEEERAKQVKQRGFSGVQHDMATLYKLARTSTDASNASLTLIDKLKQGMLDNPDERQKAILEDISNRVTAVGHLILFRYFDFQVEAGNAYRYRVRIIYNNPGFERGLDEVVDISVAERNERETPWSEPTEPVVIPPDYQRYLEDIDPKRAEPIANIEMFEWFRKTGTIINAKLPVKLGQFLGGKVKTPLLDPAKLEFSDQEVEFTSPEMLVDVVENPTIYTQMHPDLEFDKSKPLRQERLDLVNRATVVNDTGDLEVIDPVSEAQEHAISEKMKNAERGPFNDILESNRATENASKSKDGKSSSLDKAARNYDENDSGERRARKKRDRNNPTMRRSRGKHGGGR